MNTTPIKKPEPAKKPDFEKSLGRLEEVVRRLESPQLSLDDAMKLFEEGVELSRECQKQLEEAEGKVEILLKKADGKLTAQPFDPERESELREHRKTQQPRLRCRLRRRPDFLKKIELRSMRTSKIASVGSHAADIHSSGRCGIACRPGGNASGRFWCSKRRVFLN